MKIVKNIKKGSKIKVGDWLNIPSCGRLKVIGIYKLKDDYTIFCEFENTKKHVSFSEKQVIKYKESHLRLVK